MILRPFKYQLFLRISKGHLPFKYPVFLPTYLLSVQHASVFSRFRRKVTEDTDGEEGDSDKAQTSARKMWLETLKECEPNELAQLKAEGSTKLCGIELRRLKKQAFLKAIELFIHRSGKIRRGFNQFAQAALQQMYEHEVHEDLQCYKAILSVFPTGRMVVTSFLQAEWGHYPRQQSTVVQLLQQMTSNYVLPDDEVGQMIINIFGWRNRAMQQYRHTMYWVPKLFHANPWPTMLRIVDELETDPLRLARLIAERISPDQTAEFEIVRLPVSEEDRRGLSSDSPCSLVSAQSPEQRALLAFCMTSASSSPESPVQVYLDGPSCVWYRNLQAAYYTMWTDLKPPRVEKQTTIVEERERLFSSIVDLRRFPLFGLSATTGPTDSCLNEVSPRPSVAPQQPLDLCQLRLPATAKTIYTAPMNINELPVKFSGRHQQPEFDSRWQAMRRSHVKHFLPAELSSHEQAEGCVLAVAVVTPSREALVNQKQLFDRETDLVQGQPTGHASLGASSRPPVVPRPAPLALLKHWTGRLQQANPSLANAVLVMRVSEEAEDTTTGSDYPSISSDRVEEQDCKGKILKSSGV